MNSNSVINMVEQRQLSAGARHPKFSAGDRVAVSVRVRDGERERIQLFEGIVIGLRNRGLNSSFLVRRISYGVGVERTFQLHSPLIDSIEVKRRGDVRKAKIFYLRDRRGRSARIRERLKLRPEEVMDQQELSALQEDERVEAERELVQQAAQAEEQDADNADEAGTQTETPAETEAPSTEPDAEEDKPAQ